MNKKILIISSLLMALSIFSISCAKSVTAPEAKPPVLTDEQYNSDKAILDLNNLSISVLNEEGLGQVFRFSSLTDTLYKFQGSFATESGKAPADLDNLLDQLKSIVNKANLETSYVYFSIGSKWSIYPESKNATASITLDVNAKPGYSLKGYPTQPLSFNLWFTPEQSAEGGWAGF